ncbi:hypothetical protein ATN37_25790 [Rhodococcus sp. MH15]|nr:hypothetical protein [Rhodococcus sp. MH15]
MQDFLIFYFIPLVFGLLVGFFGAEKFDIAAILASVAVFTGLIFNLAFNIFDKSLQMRRDPFQSADRDAIQLVEELRANVNYTVLVGIVLTGTLATSLFFDMPNDWTIVTRVGNGLIAALLLHMLFMSGMVLKRFTILHGVLKP